MPGLLEPQNFYPGRVAMGAEKVRRGVVRLLSAVISRLKPEYEGGSFWLLTSGVLRIVILLLASLGTQRVFQPDIALWLLTGLFIAAMACGIWFLIVVRFQGKVSPALVWTQVLLDFTIVAATLSYTGGHGSYFSFLFVVIILEAGMLMGFFHGFVFAFLSMTYILTLQPPDPFTAVFALPYWYSLLLQGTALFITALISGQWNERINRLKRFQREILDNMVSGFLFCDLDGKISIANKAACAILDIDEASLVGQNATRTPLCGAGKEYPVVTALQTGSDYINYEYSVETKGGRTKVLELTTHKMLGRTGRMQALIVTFKDITEMAEMRQMLRRNDRLAAVGESATELTHEIRNPLASLQSAVEELQRNLASPDMAQRLAAIALRESRHLNGIVTSFLDFARNPEINREAMELGSFLDSLGTAYSEMHPDIEFSVIRGDTQCFIAADPVQMRQLCDNILMNSVEAMDGRGMIRVELTEKDRFAEIAFHDTGPGISPASIPRLFDPFYTEKKHGVGMGLAVCLRIVTAHDGSIQAVPHADGGATIIVRLPKRSD